MMECSIHSIQVIFLPRKSSYLSTPPQCAVQLDTNDFRANR
ncbi:hypothetical protein Mal15_59340 [Stieleria maiorica]|uniref:Uncharacterized protein n=1 Tax=Stieleria maiorica TaxID=2795974 RepID=A0A5B9MKP9_9BACT|nr:hypothetical protein Mal15_59340 [Stieleria maiorica]